MEVYVFMSYKLLGEAINYSWLLQRGSKTQWNQHVVGKVTAKSLCLWYTVPRSHVSLGNPSDSGSWNDVHI